MPQLKWVASTGEVCESEAEAIEVEERHADLKKMEDFLEEFPDFDEFLNAIEATLTGGEFLKACLRWAYKNNTHLTEVFGDGFKGTIAKFLY